MKKLLISFLFCGIILGGSFSFADLSISSEKNVNTDERISLTINTDDNYTGKIKFIKREYRKNSGDSWSSPTSSKTSSTYFSDYSSERSNGYYKITSDDDGEKEISKFIKFKKEGYYRIYAEDIEGDTDSIIINVGIKSTENDISLSTNKKSPTTQQFINLTIETNNDYTGKLTFSAKYKDEDDSKRTSISDLTSSTYFTNYSYDRKDGYYKMIEDDDGEITLKSLVKFKKEGYYRIYVTDKYNNESYIQFAVDIEEDEDDEDSDEEFDDEEVEDEIFIARNGKKYTIQYVPVLRIYTSKDLKQKEYFINSDYIKRYIDSKNPQKGSNRGRITTSYLDKSDNDERFVAPNGKVYYITEKNGIYSSEQITSGKTFSSLKQLKLFIRDKNPLIGM